VGGERRETNVYIAARRRDGRKKSKEIQHFHQSLKSVKVVLVSI
jgi:hypothetical protein